jgi:hypothetical protein
MTIGVDATACQLAVGKLWDKMCSKRIPTVGQALLALLKLCLIWQQTAELVRSLCGLEDVHNAG